MNFVFLKHQKPTTLQDEVKSTDLFFSNGLPVECNFKNGWYCLKCGKLTEHKEEHHFRTCQTKGCGFSRSFALVQGKEAVLKHRITERNLKAFEAAIKSYVNLVEIEVLEQVVDEEDDPYLFARVLLPKNYGLFRNRIFHNHKFEVEEKMRILEALEAE